MTNRPRIRDGLEIDEVGDGLIVCQQPNDQIHHLNRTAAVVFELCDGSRDAAEIATAVRDLFGLDRDPTEEVRACISQLAERGLLV
jgi:Coenzyme PQQ synthesis protein D (PqqD)